MEKNDAEKLTEKYNNLLNFMGLTSEGMNNDVYLSIREILNDFIHRHRRTAVYCYGKHTHMLMVDFVYELRDIVCIVDNGDIKDNRGYNIIKDFEIEKHNLDGVIISSFIHKEEIKTLIETNHSSIDFLDIYDELEKKGIILGGDYYNHGPYQTYLAINEINNQLNYNFGDKQLQLLKQLLLEYIHIKDFRMALKIGEKLYNGSKEKEHHYILDEVEKIYNMELNILSQIDKNNILMLCLDGLRRCDLLEGGLNKVRDYLQKSAYVYENAYSYSTMTYESLIPTYSENTNQRTKYYLNDAVESENCRFVKKALEQGRKIAVYGDGVHYIYNKDIKYSGKPQTLTEKIWDFVIDSSKMDCGLFYLHELYESHFSFPNPYTEEKIIADGMAMVFDYLPQNGGKLRTDYCKQHQDSLSYIDDTLAPFLNVLPCSLVLFADHGNMLLENNTKLEDIKAIQLIASEEWIRIPLAVVSPHYTNDTDTGLVSLIDFNDIMLSVMGGEKHTDKKRKYIKIGRSAIYNPDFLQIYRMMDKGYGGEAYEGFIFQDGYKLIVYSNKEKELYRIEDDSRVFDNIIVQEKYDEIVDEITVF